MDVYRYTWRFVMISKQIVSTWKILPVNYTEKRI